MTVTWPGADTVRQLPFRRVFTRLNRPVPSDAAIVTAFTNGEVTFRSNRSKIGYHEAADLSGFQGVKEGDFVVHGLDIMRGSVGVSDSTGAISAVCIVCTPSSEVDPRYIAYAIRLQAASGYPKALARGVRDGGADFRRWATLAELPVPVPALSMQRAVADYLDRETAQIDTLIAKQEQLIATLRERRTALVEHTMKNLSLEPETTMTAIRHIGTTSSGAGFPPAEQGQKGLELPFFKVKHLSAHGRLKYSTADDTISRETASRLRATVFPAGTVCYAKVGAALLLGRFRRTTTPACIDNNMSGLIPNGRVDAGYLLWALTRVRFEALVNPGAVPSLSDSKFVEWKLPVPPLEKQSAVATQLQIQTAKIDTLIAKAEY